MTGTGLNLARRFFAATKPLLETRIPGIMERAAVGLVGEGSECFGFDDEISRDHDWGPAFCIWLPKAELVACASRLEEALAELPETFEGMPSRLIPERRAGRVGPQSIESFYARFTGLEKAPCNWQEWRSIPEEALAACTNGEVFQDGPGLFSARRTALLNFYPEDVRRKKMAARCMIMAQAGQYNLPRSLQRGEYGAAMLAAARFAEAALSMAFLLNRRPMPFYKWACRAARNLPLLGPDAVGLAELLAGTRWNDPAEGVPAVEAVEEYCTKIADMLRREGLASEGGDWLWTLGVSVQMGIREPDLRRLDVMRD